MNATPLPPSQGDCVRRASDDGADRPRTDDVTAGDVRAGGAAEFDAALASFHRWSANLGEAAMTTAAALMESAATKAMSTPFSGPNPAALAWPALLDAVLQAAQRPEAMAAAQQAMLQWAAGCSQIGLEALFGVDGGAVAADRRFADAAWKTPSADVARRLYAHSADCARTLAREAPVSEERSRRELEFFTTALVEALSPANSLFSNPAAWNAAVASDGETLARGARSFAEDLRRSDSAFSVSQTDLTPFKVGENIAATPGKVVFRNCLFELLQYSPTTAQVHERPLVIITPWINKFYIVDLQPANSMVKWLTDQGFTVFVTSWVNPDPSYAEIGFDDYVLRGVLVAIGKALEQTGQSKANVVGYCIGGTAVACAMAYLAARKVDSPIESATFFAAQQDFSEAGELLLFSDEAWLAQTEAEIDRAGGVLPGQVMAATFNQLRPRDLIWSPFVDNYLLGKPPKAFDLLFWNADSTRLPKRMHLGYIRDFYQNNALARGELTLAGVKLDLSAVKTPVYVLASKEDHIAPFASVYRGARLFGGPVTFTLAGSGHIAGVINPPAKGKYQHWLNSALPETPDAWQAQAQEHAGSWWPHWRGWLAERSGEPAPARDPSTGPLDAQADAPGAYVLERC